MGVRGSFIHASLSIERLAFSEARFLTGEHRRVTELTCRARMRTGHNNGEIAAIPTS